MCADNGIQERELIEAHEAARAALLAERVPAGYWPGWLSSSALATATAVSALSVQLRAGADGGAVDRCTDDSALIASGLRWLAREQNPDGGWGDSPVSQSNISATLLCRAAFSLAGAAGYEAVLARADGYIERAGGLAALRARYGLDRTFAVPILANCALAGRADWHRVARLPFEFGCLPTRWLRFFRLHVVSYALPALIAIGQLVEARHPSWNPLVRLVRRLAAGPSLGKLGAIQPASGGFLEAIPLTSFVVMSLVALGHAGHPVVRRGLEFIRRSVRPDGSWPVDTNLSVWVTTLSINALAVADEAPGLGADAAHGAVVFDPAAFVSTRDWLLGCQFRSVHPYTESPPGGWGWSHAPGSVPDADDTSGAIIALCQLPAGTDSDQAIAAGMNWLLGLQNRDGGWPTFCRGWGKLPFDRSGTDLTAHVLRALAAGRRRLAETADGAWRASGAAPDGHGTRTLRPPARRRLASSLRRGLRFLARLQQPDGAWVPLWFGNERAGDEQNRTYGTARVLACYRALGMLESGPARRGVSWLCRAQNADGGWGGAAGLTSTVEETALATEALAAPWPDAAARQAWSNGLAWLIGQVRSGNWRKPSPIGLYFAKLWYFEKLYPLVFTVAALGRARCLIHFGRQSAGAGGG